MRRQRHAQKRSSSDSDGAPRVPPRFLHRLGALVGLGAGFGGAWGPRRSPGGGALVGLLLQMRMLLRPFPRSAFGCSSRDARWTRAQSLPWEHLRAAHS